MSLFAVYGRTGNGKELAEQLQKLKQIPLLWLSVFWGLPDFSTVTLRRLV